MQNIEAKIHELRERIDADIAEHNALARTAKGAMSTPYHRGARDALKAIEAFAIDIGMMAAENAAGIGALGA